MKKFIYIVLFFVIVLLSLVMYNNWKQAKFITFVKDMNVQRNQRLITRFGTIFYVAFEDLNDDGKFEIISYAIDKAEEDLFWKQLHILTLKDNYKKTQIELTPALENYSILGSSYKHIDHLLYFSPEGRVEILRHKTNGFHDLKILLKYVNKDNVEDRYYVLKYTDGAYRNSELYESLGEVLINNRW